MAETLTPNPATTKAAAQPKLSFANINDAIAHLEDKAKGWIENFSGKLNHNPYIQVGKFITPLIDELKKVSTLTDAHIQKIAALPADAPVIDPNYVAPVAKKVSAPQPV